jgi:hypothetical protein
MKKKDINDLKKQFAKLISCYLDNKINLDDFRKKFDEIYYHHDYNETSFISWFMGKLSFTTNDRLVFNDPNEAGTITESDLKRYCTKILKELVSDF